MKTKLLSAGFLLAVSVSPLTQAAGVTWDVNGPAGGGPILDLNSLDWSETSFAAEGGNTAIVNFVTGVGSTDFRVYTHASLAGTKDSNGVFNTPAGLNSSFEYTLVASFVETVSGLFGSTAFFTAKPTEPSFFEIYYGPVVNAVAVSGSGYRDGTLVMSGVLDNAAAGNFTVTSFNPDGSPLFVDLDQAGPDGNINDYDGQLTQEGTGSNGNLIWKTIKQDNSFFNSPIDILTMTNISQALAFTSIDPSDCFTNNKLGVDPDANAPAVATDTECDTAHVDGLLNPATQPNAGGGFVPNAASFNTILPFPGAGGNPDFIAQTDFNSSLTPGVRVPEPASLLLLGTGLLGMLGFSAKRKMS